MAYKSGKQYSGVKGKVVELAEHNFAEGRLFIRVRFQDKTELCWQVDCALTLRMADLSDWKSGNWKHLKTFVKNAKEGEL
jgi:hypothetical protein